MAGREVIVKYKDDTDRLAINGGEYVQDLVRCKDCAERVNEEMCPMAWYDRDHGVWVYPEEDSEGFCSCGVTRFDR